MATKIYITLLTTVFFTQTAWSKINLESFQKEHVPQQLLVKFKGADHHSANKSLNSFLALKVKSFEKKDLAVYEFPKEVDLQKAAFQLQEDPNIEFVELNHYHYLQATPNDPQLEKQYGLHNHGQSGGAHDADIDAPAAWEVTKGSRRVLIGVIDTGVDYTHPDLAKNYWVNPGEDGKDSRGRSKRTNGIDDDGNGYVDDYKGWDFYNNDNDPQDRHSHGTHCAGIIAARGNNSQGITGVNWYASIVGLKIFSDSGKTRTDAIVSAIEYASKLKLPITNNSWGSYTYSEAIRSAIVEATNKGMLFVAAAGNYRGNNDSKPFYPASYKISGVLSVAASDHKDQLASFSNYGAQSVDIAAPGNRIYSTIHRGRYAYKNGTSMAAPFVSGVAGLLKAKNSRISARSMKRKIISSGDSVSHLKGLVESGRRVNARRALR